MSRVYVNEDEIEYDPEWAVHDYAGRTESDIFIPVKKVPGWRHIWKAIVEFDYLSVGVMCVRASYNLLAVYFVFLNYAVTKCKQHLEKDPNDHFLIYYCILDCSIACSIIFVKLLFLCGSVVTINDPVIKQFYCWSMNAFILSFLHTCMVAFEQTYIASETSSAADFENATDMTKIFTSHGSSDYFSFADLLAHKNYIKLGLGLFKDRHLKTKHKQSVDLDKYHRRHCLKEVLKIIKRSHIDQTFGFMTLSNTNDDLIMQINSIYQDVRHVDKNLEKIVRGDLSIFGHYDRKDNFSGRQYNIITNFLLPHYKYTRKFQESDFVRSISITGGVIFIKVIIPVFIFISKFDLFAFLYTLFFIGFYMHYLVQLLETFKNDDLKTKNYTLMALIKLISLEDFTHDTEKKQVINMGCKLSLLSWDQARHISIQMESKRNFQNNFMYMFLVLYAKVCLVTYLICTAQSYTYISLGDVCTDQILVYNDHIDLALVALASLYRIYFGSMFNGTFDDIREKISRINRVYDDMCTQFDYYFTPGVSQEITGSLHHQLVGLIIRQSLIEFSEQIEKDQIMGTNENGKDLLEELKSIQLSKIKELRDTTTKIRKILKRDENHYSDLFLGYFHSDFSQAQQIVSFLFASFIPTVFSAVMKYASYIQ